MYVAHRSGDALSRSHLTRHRWFHELLDSADTFLRQSISTDSTAVDLAHCMLGGSHRTALQAAEILRRSALERIESRESWLLPSESTTRVRALKSDSSSSNGEAHRLQIAAYVLTALRGLSSEHKQLLESIPWQRMIQLELALWQPSEPLGHCLIAASHSESPIDDLLTLLCNTAAQRLANPSPNNEVCWGFHLAQGLGEVIRTRRRDEVSPAWTDAIVRFLRARSADSKGMPSLLYSPPGFGPKASRHFTYVGHLVETIMSSPAAPVTDFRVSESEVFELSLQFRESLPAITIGAVSHLRRGLVALGREWPRLCPQG